MTTDRKKIIDVDMDLCFLEGECRSVIWTARGSLRVLLVRRHDGLWLSPMIVGLFFFR